MPWASIEKRRQHGREYQRRKRKEAREAREDAACVTLSEIPGEPIDKLDAWARDRLKVPHGHHLAGQPMRLPEYGRAFLRDALVHRESLLCLGRKNAKSAIVAVYLLARLVGPLAAPGWRGAVCSVNRPKAAELKVQMQEIAEASGLAGLRWWRSPAPGWVESAYGRLDVLSADRNSGAASSFDDVVLDETGLLTERDRALVNGLRSSTSARDGRVLHLTIRGSSPFVGELLALRHDPAVSVHLHEAPAGCQLDDEDAWHAANPGLRLGIKSARYMADRARLAAAGADEADFRAHDLNQNQDPAAKRIVRLADWEAVEAIEAPRSGPVCVGVDIGGSSSMTAAVGWWPESGRMEAWGAFPGEPNLVDRGQADGVGDRYQRMQNRGELTVFPGRSTPVASFLAHVAELLDGYDVIACGADRYRRAEVEDAMTAAALNWPIAWVGQGAGAVADGSRDVRALQRAVLDRSVAPTGCELLMGSAIMESRLRFDPLGNPSLDKGRQKGRIDALSAAVIAAGLAERYRALQRARPIPGELRAIPFGGGNSAWG